MRFTLKPAVQQIALAFPILLIALPVAMSAGSDKPGPVLPPPSLYDAPPANATGAPVPAPAAGAATQEPAKSAAETMKPAPAAAAAPVAAKPIDQPKPAIEKTAAKPAPASAAADTVAAEEPWYRRWFGWLLPKKSTAQPDTMYSASEREVAGRAGGSGRSSAYAYDAPNRAIRTGMLGQCVRTGLWTQDDPAPDCGDTAMAKAPAAAANKTAAAPAAKPAPATATRQAKAEPVEVVPLPPAPPAAREEQPLEQAEIQEDTITALAESHLMPEPDFDKLTMSAGALFALSSTSIKPSGHEKLDEFVVRLKEMPFETVTITGHTDPTGSKASNDRLSKRRAEAVKKYLVAKGVQPSRIKTVGKGGSEPLPKTRDCDALPRVDKIICYAPDRRVEIEVTAGKPNG